MRRRRTARAVTAALPIVLLLAAGCGRERARESAGEDAAGGEEAEEVELAVDLYFPAPAGALRPERRRLVTSGRTEEQAAAVVEALLAGPEGEDLLAPFADGVELAGLYLAGEGIAYVDLRPSDGAGPPAVGSTEERQMVYSLVNSVALNLPEIDRVVLLWNGAQPASFAGHLDTGRPLAPDPGLVVR